MLQRKVEDLVVVPLYLAAGVLASAVTARKSGWDLLALLLLVFPCYHFG